MLTLTQGDRHAVAHEPILLDGRRVDDVRVYSEPVQTLQERMGTGGNNVPVVAQETALSFDTQFGSNANVFTDQAPTLKASQQPPSVTQNKTPVLGSEIVGSLMASDYKFPQQQQVDENKVVVQGQEPTLIVRRLTPLECERLMGWPDNHTATGTNGAVSDTNRYKMCGNGVASPVAQWIAKHILATRPDAN
jgi:DNA (cytosine-5)-methyltransferase 1